MSFDLIIFDFDGVIADSEELACGVAARYATELGAPMSEEDGLDLFMGKRLADVQRLVEARTGKLHPIFGVELQARTLASFAEELQEVSGATAFIRAQTARRKCIASSSSHSRLQASISKLGLGPDFGDAIFSADDVGRGKPFPDLFLHAAACMGVAPESCVVIEDSVGGVQAAVAANMAVVGLLAGSHIRDGHAARLAEAGADAVVASFIEVAAWIETNDGRRAGE